MGARRQYLIVLFAILLTIPVHAATLRVPAVHSDIATALAAAAHGDTVLVSAGSYFEHDLVLPPGVTLRGATGHPSDVIIDGQRAGRCVYSTAGDATTRLEAVTLTGGLPAWGSTPNNYYGAGLFVDGGTIAVSGCVFTGNEASIGGGAFVDGTGSPTFTDCLFDGNEASESAGLCLSGACDPVVRSCTFRNGNRTVVGGGVTWTGNGTALLEGCVIEDNTVLETGGGVEIIGFGAVAILRDCLIRGNHADLGAGGLFVNNSGRAVLEDCTVTGNTAGDFAGGVEVRFGAVLEGRQVTIRDNQAPTGPDGTVWTTGTVTLVCCEVDLARWDAAGPVTLDNDGCGVATERQAWDHVKALYR